MDLRQWWLDHKDGLMPDGTAWATLRVRHWPRVKETSLDAWKRSAKAREWISKHPTLVIAPVVITIVLFLFRSGQAGAAATVIGAWFLLIHNIAQRAADFRRRITETYTKAVSQLASDKPEERLGGIYTLESISKESPDDYWTVMETLTAFVRKYSQRNYAEFKKSYERISQVAHTLWEEKGQPEGKDDEIWREAIQRGEPPETEIIAVLTVIERRVEQNEQNWKREEINDWRFDFNRAVLKKISLMGTHLERANFRDARLEQAYLAGVHLERADLGLAHLQSAILVGAHLQGAILWKTHLEGANLTGAHLKRANFFRTHLEGADLFGASDVSTEQLLTAYGDAATRLPKDVDRPPHWPSGSPRPADVGPRLKSHKFSPLEMSQRTNRI